MDEIIIPKLFCLRCEKTWAPRINKLPKYCPKCKSPYWNKSRRGEIKDEKGNNINYESYAD